MSDPREPVGGDRRLPARDGLSPARSRFLQVTPLFHVGGVLMMLLCASCPCTLVLHRSSRRRQVLAALSDEGMTHSLLVPAMIRWGADAARGPRPDVPALERVGYGAAPMPPELLAEATEVLRCDFVQGYGLTETCGVVTALRRRTTGADRPRSAPAPDARFPAARSGSSDPTESSSRAERPARSSSAGRTSPGLRRRPEAAAEVLRDGWLHTGDVGRWTRTATSRSSTVSRNMDLVGGENVYPSEVEAVLRTHPAVADVAVIGISHKVWGEEVLAVVVVAGEAPADLERSCCSTPGPRSRSSSARPGSPGWPSSPQRGRGRWRRPRSARRTGPAGTANV